MPIEDDVPMMAKEDVEVVGRTMMMCRSSWMDKLLFSIIGRVYLTYKFFLIWE